MVIVLHVLAVLGCWVYVTFCYASLFNRIMRDFRPDSPFRAVCLRLRQETKPFALPGLLVLFADSAVPRGLDGWGVAGLAVCLFTWLYWRKDSDDDDRWKRRRKKAASKVAEVSGRLQVVPEPAS